MRHATDKTGTVTITRPVTSKTTLDNLPPSADFSLPPWGLISTATLAHVLRLDRGVFGTWRLRGLGPKELPADLFAMGRANIFLVSDVLAWLAARNGLTFDQLSTWQAYLSDVFGIETADPSEARLYAATVAQGAGPNAYEGVKFSKNGFEGYIKLLLR